MADNEDEEIVEKASALFHGLVLRIACMIIGRDYRVITKFQSFREENFTILCFFATIVVVTMAVGTLFTAIDYVLYDYVRPYVGVDSLTLINKWKFVIPSFWGFAIYVIDMSILNGQRINLGHERTESLLKRLFQFNWLRFLFAKPTLTFRFLLILSSATLSATFVITKLNSQLIGSNAQLVYEKWSADEKRNTDIKIDKLYNDNRSIEANIKTVKEELVQAAADIKRVDIDRERQIATIQANYSRLLTSEREKLENCEIDCPKIQARIASIKENRNSEIREASVKAASDKRELNVSTERLRSNLAELEKEKATNLDRMKSEGASLVDAQNVHKQMTDEHIRMQQSFGALIRYMIDSDDSGRYVSIGIFCILLLFFSILDSAILLMKFSYESLYDRQMDIIHDRNKRISDAYKRRFEAWARLHDTKTEKWEETKKTEIEEGKLDVNISERDLERNPDEDAPP